MTYRTPEDYIYQGKLAHREPPKPCTRCGGKLSSAAKAAGSEVCVLCAVNAGELTGIALPIFPMNTAEDWNRMMDRLNSLGTAHGGGPLLPD